MKETFVTRVVVRDGWPVARKIPVTRLRIAMPGRARRVMELETQVVRIGSASEGNDVVLDDNSVSSFHLTITWDERGPRLRDLESTNGTYVDGVRAIETYLRAGSVIQLGRVEVLIEEGGRTVDEPLYEGESFGSLIGRSVAMRSLFASLARVAASDAKVLIEGETGTGKELCARAIHEHSDRNRGPFVVLDCAALSSGTLQSQLFGHEIGAYTGAMECRIGHIEAADGGTLFLDEIGELPLELQPNLLRVLETREVRKLGASRANAVNVRIVAATNRDLRREVNRGTFRKDLYYRLSTVHVEVPPLRERLEDLPLLVEHLARQALLSVPEQTEKVLRRFTPAALTSLTEYHWPGNVRELRNVVERSLALDEIKINAAPATDSKHTKIPLNTIIDIESPMIDQRRELVEQFERTYLMALIEHHQGKISPASRASLLDRAYLRRLLKKYR